MREIKFRAWDGERLKMANVSDITFDVKTCTPSEILCVYQLSMEDVYGEGGSEPCDIEERWRPIEKLVLMQFTGLRDRHEVEIFEGDVISRPVSVTDWNKKQFNITKESMERALIVWDEENAGFEERFHPHKKMHPCFEIVRLADVEMEIEVIGNIYANPELKEG